MAQQKPGPSTVETGEQVPARPHDSGSQANASMVWTPAPRRYGTPQRTRLRGLAPAMSRKHRCLTGLI